MIKLETIRALKLFHLVLTPIPMRLSAIRLIWVRIHSLVHWTYQLDLLVLLAFVSLSLPNQLRNLATVCAMINSPAANRILATKQATMCLIHKYWPSSRNYVVKCSYCCFTGTIMETPFLLLLLIHPGVPDNLSCLLLINYWHFHWLCPNDYVDICNCLEIYDNYLDFWMLVFSSKFACI